MIFADAGDKLFLYCENTAPEEERIESGITIHFLYLPVLLQIHSLTFICYSVDFFSTIITTPFRTIFTNKIISETTAALSISSCASN